MTSTTINHKERLSAVRAQMAARNIGLLFLPPGANLFYLTGIPRREAGGTDHNAYGDWAVGAYIDPNEGITILAPRMGAEYYENAAQDKPWIGSVRLVRESESPFEIMRDVLQRLNLSGKKVMLDDHTWAQSLLAFRQLLPDAQFELASAILAPLRMIKSEEELDRMRRAGEITEQAFAHALGQLKPGVTEIEIAAEIDYQFKALGAEFTSFVTGVFFGGEAHDRMHGHRSPKRLAAGDSVMFDLGCVVDGYCSDFGRTAFCGDPPDEYVKIHELNLHAQRAGMEAMRAGQATGAQVNEIARAIIRDAGYDAFFTHRLGHGIGITVHEPPWLDVVEQTVLQANMTFTVEPSIVIPGRFGNRVEDVVCVTERGGVSFYQADHRLYLVGGR